MQSLRDKILNEGRIVDGKILKVDSFLNHQLDIQLFEEMGREFAKRFEGQGINKIITIETSGIAIATAAAPAFGYCPVVFAKKHQSLNLDAEVYQSSVYSFTKQQSYQIKIAKKYLNEKDRVLVIDDFLANGKAVEALEDIIRQAGATLVGVGIAIEKGFQDGGRLLRDSGIHLESLAIVNILEDGTIVFKDEQSDLWVMYDPSV